MRSLRINFSKKGEASLDLYSQVSGVENCAQKAAVNVVTRRGSDTIHITRGTILHVEASDGLLINPLSAMHSVNFAALETRKFLQKVTPPSAGPEDSPKEVGLQLESLTGGVATTNLFVTVESGATFGTDVSTLT